MGFEFSSRIKPKSILLERIRTGDWTQLTANGPERCKSGHRCELEFQQVYVQRHLEEFGKGAKRLGDLEPNRPLMVSLGPL